MSARKIRPAHGTPVAADMSMRDKAAALGITTAEISRWTRLAQVPTAEFESILQAHQTAPRGAPRLTAQRIIDLSQGCDTSQVRRAKCCPHCGKPLAGGAQ